MGYSCAPFGGRNVPYSHSLLRSIRQELLKFGERTRATAGSDDFTDDDFFPNLDNLFLNDMGDNLNANSAAPVAPYVFLSFQFEIMVEFMFLVYVLDSICSSTMLVHMISLISVIAVMIYFMLIQTKSRSNLLIYSTVAPSPTSTHVSWMAWLMPPRSPSSTTMSARRRFRAR